MKNCLICEKELIYSDLGISSATIWKTTGNYGSTVYDPLSENVYLEAYICDECLKKKKTLLKEVHFRNTREIISIKEPDFNGNRCTA